MRLSLRIRRLRAFWCAAPSSPGSPGRPRPPMGSIPRWCAMAPMRRMQAALHAYGRANSTEAFWPPNPKPLAIAARTGIVTGGVGDIIEVAVRVGVVEVDRRRHDPVPDRQDAGDGSQRRRRPEQVPGQRFGRGDGQVVGMLAEGRPDRVRLGDVPHTGAGRVGRDVVDLLRAPRPDRSRAMPIARAAWAPLGSGLVRW